jgi:hypothetical protein
MPLPQLLPPPLHWLPLAWGQRLEQSRSRGAGEGQAYDRWKD